MEERMKWFQKQKFQEVCDEAIYPRNCSINEIGTVALSMHILIWKGGIFLGVPCLYKEPQATFGTWDRGKSESSGDEPITSFPIE